MKMKLAPSKLLTWIVVAVFEKLLYNIVSVICMHMYLYIDMYLHGSGVLS